MQYLSDLGFLAEILRMYFSHHHFIRYPTYPAPPRLEPAPWQRGRKPCRKWSVIITLPFDSWNLLLIKSQISFRSTSSKVTSTARANPWRRPRSAYPIWRRSTKGTRYNTLWYFYNKFWYRSKNSYIFTLITFVASFNVSFRFCKIRAASVLRKAKDDDEVNKSDFAGNNGGNRSQEVIALERMVEALNTKIGDLRWVENRIILNNTCSVALVLKCYKRKYGDGFRVH